MKKVLGLLGALALIAGCADTAPESVGGQVEINAAALNLPGIADAVWDIKVENNNTPNPDLVWSARITSTQYGDGAGSATYVGPCDADPNMNSNTITVNIRGIYTTGLAANSAGGYGDPAPAGGEAFNNPGDLTRTFICLENQDVFVQFDVSLMRPANQGFFDIAVNFNQIYCSAKFDCCYNDIGTNPSVCEGNESINLLHNSTGSRAATYVLGFACTAGNASGIRTALLLDNITVECVGNTNIANGNYTMNVNPALNDGNQGSNAVFYQWAAYRGEEFPNGISKLYWNFAFGVGSTDLTGCTLHTKGTADNQANLDDGVDIGAYGGIKTNVTYPYIVWDVPLNYGGSCTEHPLNASALVNTTYTGTVHSGLAFDYNLTAAAAQP